MFVTVIALKYAFLVSQRSYGHFLKLNDSILLEQYDKYSPFNSTHYVVLYPQNWRPYREHRLRDVSSSDVGDYLTVMPKLQSTYDGRLIYKTSYEGRKAFLKYDSLTKL